MSFAAQMGNLNTWSPKLWKRLAGWNQNNLNTINFIFYFGPK
jgi:hypothetical protein